ncbi:polysaccharide pyruvyl transferase family protein [Streptomyces melanosporofaciens]|uniref:Polysaccharide pyruvyl transferase n=1 Tax=Streptomyces melanosporofaciens TaxID=67327 RepID=A0A1H4X536_STRMJ|nr:polysaccharide pyruvyl transferase family protein [Streptomyces melanosporofaciens]SED00687.1 Polysaccharide pyruvyl transferase [Streptomyces melanosporofaciens]
MAVEHEVAMPGRVLLTGWFSFPDGEVTAGDALALRRIRACLDHLGIPYDVAWSAGYRPDALHLSEAAGHLYTHLVFLCGPAHGPQVEELHRSFPSCVRIAVGTSVIDGSAPAVTGFHHVLSRDAPGGVRPVPDLAAAAPTGPGAPVVGVVLTHGQGEYAGARRHAEVAATLTRWLAAKDCACLELTTRLDAHDWRLCTTAGQFESVVGRLDLVVTDRLHGLVLALRAGVPALAVDPVAGGAKVSAQGRALSWPATLGAGQCVRAELDRWWSWCLGDGRNLAERRREEFLDARFHDTRDDGTAGLARVLSTAAWPEGRRERTSGARSGP